MKSKQPFNKQISNLNHYFNKDIENKHKNLSRVANIIQNFSIVSLNKI